MPYADLSQARNPAERLFAGEGKIDSARAFLIYNKGAISQELTYALKYYGDMELAMQLGRMAAIRLSQLPDYALPDLLIPVPLHKKRLNKRGYNQAEWIARGFQSVWGTPMDTTHLKRIKRTETQTRKKLYERIINMETSFSLSEGQNFSNKHILIIDDVLTSGATLKACIAEFSECNNLKISIFCLSVAE